MLRTIMKGCFGLSVLLLCSLIAAASAYAADPTLTANQKKAFDKMLAAADSATAAKLKQQYGEFESLLKAGGDWNQKIDRLHKANSDKEASLRKRIGQIDAAKLAKLKQAYEQAKTRYQQLNGLYRSAKQQLAIAKKSKNLFLTGIFQAQADSLKLTVELARQDRKNKESVYRTASRAAQIKMKKIRGVLSGIDPIQVQIRAAKSALKAPKNSRSEVWGSFKKTLTKQDAATAARLLATVNGLTRQLIERQQQIYAWENKIDGLNHSAESQLNQA